MKQRARPQANEVAVGHALYDVVDGISSPDGSVGVEDDPLDLPWLVGDRIGLHPVVVIFAVMAGGQLFGFTGVLLALPLSAVIMVLLRHANRHYRASSFYGLEDVREPGDGLEEGVAPGDGQPR